MSNDYPSSSDALEAYLHVSLYNFWAQKCKNQIFEENKGFSPVFFELKYR